MRGPIVLVGLMGSGKTTVGKRLAALLGRPFVDADDALEERAGRSIADIFATDGEDAFRQLETSLLEELLDREDEPVIATGGGVVTRAPNRELLTGHPATVVWLDGSPAFLASRLQHQTHRPLLVDADPREVLTRLHAERAPLYEEVADLVVDIEGFLHSPQPKQAVAEHLAEAVLAHLGSPS
jgi:shikimate kinase